MAEQRLGIDAGQFFFADREGDARDVGRLDSLVAELLVEGNVCVAIDGGDDRRLLAGRPEFLDIRHDRLPVGVSERRVVDHDVGIRDALLLEKSFEDFVGGARIHVVGAGEHPPLHFAAVLGHQIFDSRDRLLVGSGAGVEHVALTLLAFVLHGVEQDVVELLEHRQHRLARDGGPASEYRGDLILGDELACLLREQRPIRGRVDHDRLELLAEQAALLVLLLDQHEHDVLQRRLADRHRAGERVENADLDGVLGLSGKRGRQAKCQSRRDHEQPAGKRSLDDRSDG